MLGLIINVLCTYYQSKAGSFLDEQIKLTTPEALPNWHLIPKQIVVWVTFQIWQWGQLWDVGWGQELVCTHRFQSSFCCKHSADEIPKRGNYELSWDEMRWVENGNCGGWSHLVGWCLLLFNLVGASSWGSLLGTGAGGRGEQHKFQTFVWLFKYAIWFSLIGALLCAAKCAQFYYSFFCHHLR